MAKILAWSLAVVGTILLVCLAADPALAQASRTWVSGVGDDVNPCSRTAPCKTFAGAISKTAVNGEINCLDPGGFGAVTITKSITIDCHELFGSILFAGTNGINIAFDSFNDARKTVNLRNLNLQGLDSGLIGIRIFGVGTGSFVNIEDCLINGDFGGSAGGIVDARTTGTLTVLNTTVRNMGSSGISMASSGGGLLRATLINVKVMNSNNGILAGAGAAVQISNSVVANNATVGVLAATGAQMNVDSSTISHNALGASAAGGTIRISNNNFAFNVTGLSGTVNSFTNNRFGQNGAGGTVTAIAPVNSNPSGLQ
ncbi:right-handed parallel beta-helix repeat-containing protein [Bradyrhizobium sp.]|uniref:right-handed parallel beta-helix repeat-containing protein n=1 Tax=Bradyrhizobium sp. TaxID=376 RepID=UPI003C74E669